MNGGSNIIMTKSDYIPDEIAADILSKLPSRSVLRFKIACKTWYSLISNPVFINLHTKLASRNPKILFFADNFRPFQLLELDYESSLFDDSCLSSLPRPINFLYGKIIGSCCGLVCVDTGFVGNSFSIVNPLTGKCREIPKLGGHRYLCYGPNYDRGSFHGFGFDSVANDFKLVIVALGTLACNIFSLKTNSWKTITHPIDLLPRWNKIATVLNGIFYWLVRLTNDAYEIITFDSSNETFQKLQLPQHVPWNITTGASLLEHRGCLCLSFAKCLPKNVEEIWMMKHGGWVHLLTIENSPTFNSDKLLALCISTRNEVVFRGSTQFSRRGKEEEDKLDINQYGAAVLYVETLVSPNFEDWVQTADKTKERC